MNGGIVLLIKLVLYETKQALKRKKPTFGFTELTQTNVFVKPT